jgi:hypothetical protein
MISYKAVRVKGVRHKPMQRPAMPGPPSEQLSAARAVEKFYKTLHPSDYNSCALSAEKLI